jgi:hypothetical protein
MDEMRAAKRSYQLRQQRRSCGAIVAAVVAAGLAAQILDISALDELATIAIVLALTVMVGLAFASSCDHRRLKLQRFRQIRVPKPHVLRKRHEIRDDELIRPDQLALRRH